MRRDPAQYTNVMFGPWSNVRGFERMSLCDWPGMTSCVLFLGGCSLRCPTCHNHQLAWRPESLPVLDRETTRRRIAATAAWLDGIVITGGEPSEDMRLPLLLKELRDFGLPIKLDTNGMQPHVVASLLELGLIDVFAVDVKGPFGAYPALTGGRVSADQARENLTRIFGLAQERPEAFYFRLTKVPALDANDIRIATSYLPAGFSLTQQNYKEPGRNNASVHPEERRLPGNVVGGPHCARDSQSAESPRH